VSNHLCRAAIETRLSTWAQDRPVPLRIAYENVEFKPTNGEVYLRVFLLPATTGSSDLEGSMRTFSGVYQMNVVTPINGGPGVAESIAAEIEALFPLNLRIPSGDLVVQVVSPVTAAKGGQDDVSFVVPVSFQYRADTV
jgi:hypothetical protein